MTKYERYLTIPKDVRDELTNIKVFIVRNDKEQRYSACLDILPKGWTSVESFTIESFMKKLAERELLESKKLLAPDYSDMDTYDSAYLVAEELVRLEIIKIAKRKGYDE